MCVPVVKNDLLLHEAVIKNDTDAAKRVLKDQVDVNSRNNVSITTMLNVCLIFYER